MKLLFQGGPVVFQCAGVSWMSEAQFPHSSPHPEYAENTQKKTGGEKKNFNKKFFQESLQMG